MVRNRVEIEELENNDAYQLIKTIHHQEILPFIQKEFDRRNLIIHLFVIINIALLTSSIFIGIQQVSSGTISFWRMFLLWVGGAIAGSTLIIPIHELIHGITYYLLGAPKVSYGWNPKQFYFFAVADRYVINGTQMWPLALGPFVIISVACLMGIVYLGIYWQWFFWGLLVMHSLNCIGDFGMLSFFWEHRSKRLYTFDIVEHSVSYVYQIVDKK